jgi:ABC-type nitrate/sulfonate/bicarbonate transport system substrate-binding protein
MFAFKHGLFAALMLFVLVLSACGQSDRETTQNENSAESAGETAVTGSEGVPTTADVIIDTELTTVKVVSLPFISFAPIYIAMDEGYFEEQGLAIEIVSFTQQQDTLPALVSGDVDVIGGLVSSAYLNAIARGGEIKIVADKGYIDPDGCSNFAIVANSSLLESDGQVNPDALRGQIISAQQGTWQTYYVDKELNTIGLSLADVELASIPSPAQPDALTQGSIAASAQNEPWVTILSAQGHQTILEPVQELLPESQSAVLLYGPSLLNDNPEALAIASWRRTCGPWLSTMRAKPTATLKFWPAASTWIQNCCKPCVGRPCVPMAPSTCPASWTFRSGQLPMNIWIRP